MLADMSDSRRRLIHALRVTADRLAGARARYQWSHFAHCNCGHLAQTITELDPRILYEVAFHRDGDWSEQAAQHRWDAEPDYGDRPALDEGAWEPENTGACTVTGNPLSYVFEQMHDLGLGADDVRHLEWLSDPAVRRRLGKGTQRFSHNRRENVVAYLRAWAELLEEQLPPEPVVELPLAAE